MTDIEKVQALESILPHLSVDNPKYDKVIEKILSLLDVK